MEGDNAAIRSTPALYGEEKSMSDSQKEAEVRDRVRKMIERICSVVASADKLEELFSDEATIEVRFDDYEKSFTKRKFVKFFQSKTEKIQIAQVDTPSIDIALGSAKHKCNCMVCVVYSQKGKTFHIIGSCEMEFDNAEYTQIKIARWSTHKFGAIAA